MLSALVHACACMQEAALLHVSCGHRHESLLEGEQGLGAGVWTLQRSCNLSLPLLSLTLHCAVFTARHVCAVRRALHPRTCRDH